MLDNVVGDWGLRYGESLMLLCLFLGWDYDFWFSWEWVCIVYVVDSISCCEWFGKSSREWGDLVLFVFVGWIGNWGKGGGWFW